MWCCQLPCAPFQQLDNLLNTFIDRVQLVHFQDTVFLTLSSPVCMSSASGSSFCCCSGTITGIRPDHLIFGHKARGPLAVLKDAWGNVVLGKPRIHVDVTSYISVVADFYVKRYSLMPVGTFTALG